MGSAGPSGFFGPVRARPWSRSRAKSEAACRAASAWAIPCRPTPIRASFIITNIRARPRFSSPTSQPTASSWRMTQVAEPWMPIFSSRPSHQTLLRRPGLPSASGMNLGTMKREMPRTPSGAPSTRARTRWTMFSAMSCSPPEIQILVPEMR